MNKKNFTLSAFVLMLFLTAFISNANASVGSFNDDGAEAQENDATDEQFHINAADNEDAVLYRRLSSIRDDNATTDAGKSLDAPKTLRIVTANNPNNHLFEDGLSVVSIGRKSTFLGLANKEIFPEEVYPDGTVKYNYHLFFDTAFINRGTGFIKPQYMIAVGVKTVEKQEVTGVNNTGSSATKTIKSYVEGRYLINATDSSRKIGSNGADNVPIRNPEYLLEPGYDRLAFVNAIHVYDDDRLYIVSELENLGITREQYIITTRNGDEFIDGDALDAMTKTVDGVPGKLVGAERVPTNNLMYGAYYQFDTWNNHHNDVCFSLRFVTSDAQNPDGAGADVSSNHEKRFYIESETKGRSYDENEKIAPAEGGWVSIYRDFVAVLTRGTLNEDAIPDVFNVAEPASTDWQDGKPTINENTVSEIKVTGGEGVITILNAAGKNVVVSNLLGQTIVNKVSAGNNEVIKAPKGFVIVTVDGNAYKLVVK